MFIAEVVTRDNVVRQSSGAGDVAADCDTKLVL